MIKKSLCLFLVLLMSLSLFACSAEPQAEPTEITTTAPALPKIGVLSCNPDESANKALDGFSKAIKDSGYIDGENIEVVSFSCKAEKELTSSAESLVQQEVKIIYAIGTDAAKAAKKATSDIPVVFACVDDPIGAELLKSCEKPEANVTGVCDYSPVFEQIELLHALYPDVNRIGALYNGADENAILSANLASGEAQVREIKFTLYPSLTDGEYEYYVDKALEKCDALYIPDDALSKSCLKYTLKAAKEKKVPVFAESTELVEGGCLATCITDYEHIGYSAGELAVILMRGLKTVSEMPVEYATECTPVINSKTLKSMKLTLPDEISDKALMISSK